MLELAKRARSAWLIILPLPRRILWPVQACQRGGRVAEGGVAEGVGVAEGGVAEGGVAEGVEWLRVWSG